MCINFLVNSPVQVEPSLSEMFGTRVFQISDVFGFWNICIYKWAILWMILKSKPEICLCFIYILYTYIHSQKVNLYSIFNNYVTKTKFCLHFDCTLPYEIRYEIFHLWHPFTCENFWFWSISDLRFQILNFRIRNTQPIIFFKSQIFS